MILRSLIVALSFISVPAFADWYCEASCHYLAVVGHKCTYEDRVLAADGINPVKAMDLLHERCFAQAASACEASAYRLKETNKTSNATIENSCKKF